MKPVKCAVCGQMVPPIQIAAYVQNDIVNGPVCVDCHKLPLPKQHDLARHVQQEGAA